MNAKASLWGLCGMLLVSLSGCAFGTAEMIQEHERQVMELRRQVDQLKLQVKAREEETKRLAQELEKARKLEAGPRPRRAAEADGRPRDDEIRGDRPPGKPVGSLERSGCGERGRSE